MRSHREYEPFILFRESASVKVVLGEVGEDVRPSTSLDIKDGIVAHGSARLDKRVSGYLAQGLRERKSNCGISDYLDTPVGT